VISQPRLSVSFGRSNISRQTGFEACPERSQECGEFARELSGKLLLTKVYRTHADINGSGEMWKRGRLSGVPRWVLHVAALGAMALIAAVAFSMH